MHIGRVIALDEVHRAGMPSIGCSPVPALGFGLGTAFGEDDSKVVHCPDDADWPQDLLFFDLDDGGPRNLESVGRRWRRLAVALGLPAGVSPHSLRKHLGIEAISAGLDVTKVADQLGNTSRVLRKSYVRRHQPHADVTAMISGKLGPALDEVACHRSD
ncbi:hypothetical protein [Nocardia sp. NPDC058705]|uniref:hypothetical protein n=1 Tax=Nocardia sp. NPDC058705 TaxID=3346609 RepID=UPI0036D0D9D3